MSGPVSTLLIVSLACAQPAGQRPFAPVDPPAPTPPAAKPLPTRAMIVALIDTLRDADDDVRVNAALALAAIGAEAVDPLIITLRDKNAGARAAAAYALGQIGAPARTAIEPLLKVLRDEDTASRRQAAQALARIVSANQPGGALALRRTAPGTGLNDKTPSSTDPKTPAEGGLTPPIPVSPPIEFPGEKPK